MLCQALGEPAAGARRQLVRWGVQTLDLLYPPHCAHCDIYPLAPDRPLLLCERCGDALGSIVWEACPRCGAAVSGDLPVAAACEHCRGQRFHFDKVVALGRYRGCLRDAVLRTKRPGGAALADVLGELYSLRRGPLVEALRPDLVIPVPMHWRRQLSRKTNGVQRLAAAIARALGWPLETRVLGRQRNTRLQRDLPPGERFRNVRGAFRVRPGYDLRGTTVLLVDDVLTTGATASEAAKILKRVSGVARVAVAVVARATGEEAK